MFGHLFIKNSSFSSNNHTDFYMDFELNPSSRETDSTVTLRKVDPRLTNNYSPLYEPPKNNNLEGTIWFCFPNKDDNDFQIAEFVQIEAEIEIGLGISNSHANLTGTRLSLRSEDNSYLSKKNMEILFVEIAIAFVNHLNESKKSTGASSA